ncbi:aminotransferase class IV [Clostridium aestuarii]|uniref:Aminotransferase class IV n=1 Tax=Clostridium aestuarii TaxID=338193 RepID=A0ABT4D0D8_9CLOT|nr:aminotransferase class IV [Clostridium aestuarii]MCY6483640.1 aminotransferase class IV [Clostridium aestuarii]
MNECYREKFIYNNEVKKSKEFNQDVLFLGKSLYEVLRIMEGVPLFLEDHLERLNYSAKVTNLELWMDKEEIKDKIIELCKVNNIVTGNIKIIFNFNGNQKNFLTYFIRHCYPTEEMYNKGVSTALYHAERENPNAKVINMNLREATNKVIKEKGVYEVILVDNNERITEGSKSNIFMIKNKCVYTSPVDEVLPGITRKYIIRVCERLGLKVIEHQINYKEINDLDALFISGTSPKVLPIVNVDNVKFSSQNEVLLKIMKGFDEVIESYIKI